jgi:hypothetical protein
MCTMAQQCNAVCCAFTPILGTFSPDLAGFRASTFPHVIVEGMLFHDLFEGIGTNEKDYKKGNKS